jgi:hypothetical protein
MLRSTAAFLLVAMSACSDGKPADPVKTTPARRPAPIVAPAAPPSLPPPVDDVELSARSLADSFQAAFGVDDAVAERIFVEQRKVTAGLPVATRACLIDASSSEEVAVCLDELDDAARMDVKNAYQQVIAELLVEAHAVDPSVPRVEPWVPIGAR